MSRLQLCTLWVSGELSYIERLCLISALDCGHPVALYTYGGVPNAPDGVDVRDAREIMPDHLVIRHRKTGSLALASDTFRYKLLQKIDCCWIDCDVLFLRPMKSDFYIFGRQDEQTICGAVFRLPMASTALRDLAGLAEADPIVLPWWDRSKRIKQRLRWYTGRHKKVEDLGWGAIGPHALSYFVRKHKIDQYATNPEVFYPNEWRRATDVLDPAIDFQSRLTEDTIAVHLWHNMLRDCKEEPPPAGSFLDQQCKRLGVSAVVP